MADEKKMMHDSVYSDYQNLLGYKGSKRTAMETASRFFQPDDEVLTGNRPLDHTSKDGDRIMLDTTCIKVFEDYITMVLGLGYMSDQRWFTITHRDIDVSSDNQRVLNNRAEKLYKLIGRSNYYTQIKTFEEDVVGHGHGLFMIQEDKEKFVKCSALNPYNAVFRADIYGEVYEAGTSTSYDLYSIFNMFPDAQERIESYIKDVKEKTHANTDVLNTPDKDIPVISMCYKLVKPRIIGDEELMKKKSAGYKYVVEYTLGVGDTYGSFEGLPDSIHLGRTFHKAKPLHPCRDVPTRDHPYGMGRFRDFIPKARILNHLAYALLEIAHQQYNPAKIVSAEVGNSIKLSGGTQDEGMRISAGQTFILNSKNFQENQVQNHVQLLHTNLDVKAIFEVHRQQKEEVADFLPTSANIYKTARQSIDEIRQRTEEMEKKLAPIRATYAEEAVRSHIKAMYQIAEKNGEFDDEKYQLVPEEGKNLNIRANSPDLQFDGFLLQKYTQGKARAVLQFLNLSQVIAQYNPQTVTALDGFKIQKLFARGFGVYEVLKPDQQVAQELEAIQRQQQEQQDMQDAMNQSQIIGNSTSGLADVFNKLTTGADSGEA